MRPLFFSRYRTSYSMSKLFHDECLFDDESETGRRWVHSNGLARQTLVTKMFCLMDEWKDENLILGSVPPADANIYG